MKFCCASNDAIKNIKNRKKNDQLFYNFFFNKIVIFPEITDFLKTYIYFWIPEVLPVISTTYLFV